MWQWNGEVAGEKNSERQKRGGDLRWGAARPLLRPAGASPARAGQVPGSDCFLHVWRLPDLSHHTEQSREGVTGRGPGVGFQDL